MPTWASNVPVEDLRREFDAMLLAGGAEQPRDLPVPGRELEGIHFAMEFLPQQNRRNEGDTVPQEQAILATGKRVVIIGGGDTGADCLGTSHRQGARSVHAVRAAAQAARRALALHAMAALAHAIAHRKLARGRRHARLERLHDAVHRRRAWQREAIARRARRAAAQVRSRLPGTEFTIDADLVLLAMGFLGPVRNGLIEQLGVKLDARGNVATGENYMTSVPGVFAAGDMRRGQSLVVWAIAEGRKAAAGIDTYLAAATALR